MVFMQRLKKFHAAFEKSDGATQAEKI